MFCFIKEWLLYDAHSHKIIDNFQRALEYKSHFLKLQTLQPQKWGDAVYSTILKKLKEALIEHSKSVVSS